MQAFGTLAGWNSAIKVPSRCGSPSAALQTLDPLLAQGVFTCGKHYHLEEFHDPLVYSVRMFAVNIVRIVGWGIIVLAAIPSITYLLALLYLTLTEPFSPGIGLLATLAIAATFLISSAAGALLVAFSQAVLSLQSIERSLRRIEHGPPSPNLSKKTATKDPGFGLRNLPPDHPVRKNLSED